MKSQLKTLAKVLKHSFSSLDTVQYPDQQPYLAPRYRGRIVLTRDPDGVERCVACNLCATVCPVDCIALQKTELEDGRWIAETFDINFARCIMCGFCEEACPTHAIQLTPDFEMAEYDRQNLLYRKEHLLIDGSGKYHDYNFYQVSGKQIAGKAKGEADNELPPVDIKSLLP
ncbi:NADH-quinone oxidoreductase subunit I ['Osedax' symbiont bacterium Rs2_46_30_T18]|nr:NADH-quinone oxidoreductase subunit I ['Osedax' symbiont bacterium Rs2_46_30_T18]